MVGVMLKSACFCLIAWLCVCGCSPNQDRGDKHHSVPVKKVPTGSGSLGGDGPGYPSAKPRHVPEPQVSATCPSFLCRSDSYVPPRPMAYCTACISYKLLVQYMVRINVYDEQVCNIGRV